MILVSCPVCAGRALDCSECRGVGRVTEAQRDGFFAFERLLCRATEPYHRGRIVPLSEQPSAESEALV